MSVEYFSFQFTGPHATHTLLGDRTMRGSIFPVQPQPSDTVREQNKRSKAKQQAKLLKAKVQRQMAEQWGVRCWCGLRARPGVLTCQKHEGTNQRRRDV